MSYLDRLKEEFPDTPPGSTAKTAKSSGELKTRHQEELPKLPKAPFGSFGSGVSRHISKNADPQPEVMPTPNSGGNIPEVPGDKPGNFLFSVERNEETKVAAAVEAWTPSGKRLVVTAYSAEHAEAIRRMNPPPVTLAEKQAQVARLIASGMTAWNAWQQVDGEVQS